ncbi:Phosphatidylglycerol/phosphatidylinositol transfer protein [Favolaschia claudopus]|uniref:Phosphatidylglycerol/phosphatidylinositol transfer protein n=1 Tax=Favolaschia claudopus TaxID=2862362 RepID=A0AAW0EIV6_9AGAR
MRLASIFFLSTFLLASAWEYTDCGLPTNPIQLDSIEISPDPPLPGKDLTVTAKGIVTEVIEEGATADVTVKLGLVKLLQKKFDVCEEARKANASISCPVQPGPYEVVQTVALPKEIPKAKFTVIVRGFTAESEEVDMLCLDLKIDFMKSLTSMFTSPF